MTVVVTGGAGFIGRWLVARLLREGRRVVAVDDFSNGSPENIAAFAGDSNLTFIEGDIRRIDVVDRLWRNGPVEICYHLAAEINVQHSIDDPAATFDRDVVGTFQLLEKARAEETRFVFMSTCMVYDRCYDEAGIGEDHPTKPASPYAAAKLSGEALTLSYHHAYGLPTMVLRPFNTYGPYQRTDGEGGVVAVFVRNALEGKPLSIYGDGTQTRDLLYVEDCVDFLVKAGESDTAVGQIWNAGTGKDVAINELADLVSNVVTGGKAEIRHVPHIHPQSEIWKLQCNPKKVYETYEWQAKTELQEGIRQVKEWVQASETTQQR